MGDTNNSTTQFYCKQCNYSCTNRYNYKKHLLTQKHITAAGTQTIGFTCNICGSTYKHKSGLSRHMKTCGKKTEPPVDNIIVNDELKQLLIEQNETSKRLQTEIMEQQEKHREQINNMIPQVQSVTNITNNKFNLNIFLNDDCRDAVSIQNFIQNLQIGMNDLKCVGDRGYVNGMITIMTNALGGMELCKRPLHCTDLKREILYIKQGDKWEKDTDEKTELRKLINAVQDKNYNNIKIWEEENPQALVCDTPENKMYLRIMSETLGTDSDEDEETKVSKILKHVVKEVYVNR